MYVRLMYRFAVAVLSWLALLLHASRIEEEHTLSFWDALIVAAAIQAGAERLTTEDLQDGRRLRTIGHRPCLFPLVKSCRMAAGNVTGWVCGRTVRVSGRTGP
jgi:hypothetical protein